MANNILGFKFPKNRQKWPSISTFKLPRTDSRRMTLQKTDVIGLQLLDRDVGPILFIASENILQLCIYNIYNATILSAGALY